MSILYLYNTGRNVHLELNNIHIQYLGSKALQKFVKVNRFEEGVIYVETQFSYGSDEDYIDVEDVLSEFNYDAEKLIPEIKQVIIKEENEMMDTDKKKNKQYLIDESILVSDNLALMANVGSANDLQIEVISLANTNMKAVVRFSDSQVLLHNMSDRMLERAVNAVNRNKELILDEVKERTQNAKVY